MSSITMSPAVAVSSPVSVTSRSVNWGRFALVGLATAVAAGLANVLFYYAGDAVVRYDPDFVELGSGIGIGIFTSVLAVGAVLVYAGLLRFTDNPVRLFTIVSAVFLAVSLIPDVVYVPSEPGASTAQTVILSLMHLAAAAVIVPMLTRLARPQER